MKPQVYTFTEGSGKRTKYCAQVYRGRKWTAPACAKKKLTAIKKAMKKR